jgi:uridine kinase
MKVAIELISKHIARLLDERTISIRSRLARLDIADRELPETALVMPSTPQLKYIHTMIRNCETQHEQFNFYADRLGRLVVEFGLSQLPFEERSVQTRLGFEYKGMVRCQQICGVSIVRAGIAMELPLRTICQDIPIGRLLIQTDQRSLEPQLHYCKLPPNIGQCRVLLMEAVMATGAAVMMAIRVLLDHDVPEESIIVLSMIATPQSVHALHAMFPSVRVCTSEIDWEGLTDSYHVIPGIGNFGDRYFGTD